MRTLASRDRRARSIAILRNLFGALLVALSAIALGLATHKIPRSAMWPVFAAVPALAVIGFVVARGPRACLAALLATTMFGLNTHAAGGQHGVRLIDIFWIALVGWTLRTRAREGPIFGREVGQRQVGIWLGALLVSLYPVALSSSGGFSDAFVAWVRLAETISLVWLVPYALRKIEDVEFMLGVIELSIAGEIAFAIVQSLVTKGVDSRLAGANGPDTTGLLAALLIAASIHAPVPRDRLLRVLLFAVGTTGLIMTKSVGSLTAAGVMLGVFGIHSVAKRRATPHRGLLTPARLLLLVLGVMLVAITIRPGSLPTSKTFSESTTMDRTVIATAGLELFLDHPVVGIGWSRAPYEIGSDKIDHQLRNIFGNSLRPDFLPKQSPGSVHNSYIEILAEAGLVGFACFLALLIAAARGVRRVLRSVDGDRRVAACAWCSTVLLVGVLVWWNDNALFGTQPETVLAATFLGVLAAIPLAQRHAAQAVSALGEARELSPL